MELAVLDIKGKDTGKKVKLPKEIFGVEPNDHAIYLDVKQYLANQRQGTSKSKERNEISGSTRKLRKQKGAGAARVGSIKSPIFRGGGRIFGPRPRDYGFKLNKKLKRIARFSALAYKVKDKNLVIIDEISFKEAKTKNYIKVLESLNIAENSTLLLTHDNNSNVVLSSRNLKKAKVMSVNDLNTYAVLRAEKLIMTSDCIKMLEDNLK